MTEYLILTVLTAFNTYVYFHYISNTWKNKCAPHIFSWGIWFLTNTLTFFAQLAEGGGLGAFVTLQSSVICLFVLFASIKNFHSQTIYKKDWIALILCFIGLLTWIATNDPLFSVLLNTGICLTSFIPTVIRAYKEPQNDKLYVYVFLFFACSTGFFLLEEKTLETALFPIAKTVASATTFIILAYRKISLRKKFFTSEESSQEYTYSH